MARQFFRRDHGNAPSRQRAITDFTIQSTDSTPNTGTRSYTVAIGNNSLTVNPSSLPNGSQSVAYSQTVTASGGTGPYTFAITSGALPTGLSLNAASGAITGTPTGSGVSNFTVQATDSNGNIGNRAFSVNIGTNALTVNPASLPNGSQGVVYSQTVTASGGTGSYTFTVTSGALPAGLSLNGSSGAITGTPGGSGPSNFTIRATDTSGNTGSRAYTVNIGTTTLAINAPTLPNASQGSAYSQTVVASGGTGPYVLALISGALPAGLSFNPASGAITGTPTGTGAATFTIQATDVNGNIGNRSYTINVGGNSLTINPATLPNAPKGRPYSQIAQRGRRHRALRVFAAVWRVAAGLFAGNTTSGAITGTPTVAASFSFSRSLVHDANGNFGTRTYTLSTSMQRPDHRSPKCRPWVAAQATIGRWAICRRADLECAAASRGTPRQFQSMRNEFRHRASSYNLRSKPYPIDPTAIGGCFRPSTRIPIRR